MAQLTQTATECHAVIALLLERVIEDPAAFLAAKSSKHAAIDRLVTTALPFEAVALVVGDGLGALLDLQAAAQDLAP